MPPSVSPLAPEDALPDPEAAAPDAGDPEPEDPAADPDAAAPDPDDPALSPDAPLPGAEPDPLDSPAPVVALGLVVPELLEHPNRVTATETTPVPIHPHRMVISLFVEHQAT